MMKRSLMFWWSVVLFSDGCSFFFSGNVVGEGVIIRFQDVRMSMILLPSASEKAAARWSEKRREICVPHSKVNGSNTLRSIILLCLTTGMNQHSSYVSRQGVVALICNLAIIYWYTYCKKRKFPFITLSRVLMANLQKLEFWHVDKRV